MCQVLKFSAFPPEEELCQLTHTFFQHVEEWHSVSCNVTSDKENVTVAAEVSLSQSEQVLEI